jgi:hypothetical protein
LARDNFVQDGFHDGVAALHTAKKSPYENTFRFVFVQFDEAHLRESFLPECAQSRRYRLMRF